MISYKVIKTRILERQTWGLNICCGKTDGGGVNADIVAHEKLPRMVIVDVERLPFRDDAFESVLCSHTLEHVYRPQVVYAELQRVGETVTLVVPPLWDLWVLVNAWEHRWIFLSFAKEHQQLPRYIPQPLSRQIQDRWGQTVQG
jgi:ubiquinone/menaquinone biosynthesis C-methylase UbiE